MPLPNPEQLAQQHHSEIEFKKMFPFGGPVPPAAVVQLQNHQPRQLNHPAANMGKNLQNNLLS